MKDATAGEMKIVVTAGPTREPLDPVRFLSNRSTGKMGFAIAEAAAVRGLQVVLVSGPTVLPSPMGVERIDVTTAVEMLEAVKRQVQDADVLIMSAAVSDWRPAAYSSEKLKKSAMSGTLELVRNPDILRELAAGKGCRLHVEFAAETEDLVSEASRKLSDKKLDMIVANDVSASDAGFGVDTNRVTFVTSDGVSALPLMSKQQVAARILDWVSAAISRFPRPQSSC